MAWPKSSRSSASTGIRDDITQLIRAAVTFHPWDAMAPAALSAIAERTRLRPFNATAETGCGGSTILLSRLSQRHIAFGIEGDEQTISTLKLHPELDRDRVEFVEGETKHSLPAFRFQQKLDLVLLDGPHAYPLPQVEFAYLFPQLAEGGWLVIDDLQIPSVHELFRFLKSHSDTKLEAVVGRTAFFCRTRDEKGDANPDGWWRQSMNHSLVWRYSWRDRLRRRR